ncbi:hypothetical protein J2S43_007424 [Catenuloplanes nepalensis]|uniref:Uncharacterized protein n=1 Tax=Catenuloplanes nepalensis TaxID=587533 RepID=A0ABT9N5C7_9ACTN|nr:hypothetical protein [Catenuloplanes nepalensis]MDP9798912.1 hypothetical protein [Catenuloplanes nepalensis]
MVTGLGLQLIPWESVSPQADLINPTLTTVTVIAGAAFGLDVLVATGIRIKEWSKGRVIVLKLGPRDRPPGQE